jgi:hypothetical protein
MTETNNVVDRRLNTPAINQLDGQAAFEGRMSPGCGQAAAQGARFRRCDTGVQRGVEELECADRDGRKQVVAVGEVAAAGCPPEAGLRG